MIFNKTGRLIRRNFKYRGENIPTIREYKYLVFLLTPSGGIVSGLQDLRDRGSKALAHLKSKMGEYFRKHIPTTLKLFDAIVKPILIYMADFWGCLKMPKNNPIEIFQNKFLKQILGVQVQTTNVGVLLETGRIPISIYAKKACVKNWSRIVRKKCNNLVVYSYQNAEKNNLTWFDKIKIEFAEVGLYGFFLKAYRNNILLVENILFKRLVDIFYQIEQ